MANKTIKLDFDPILKYFAHLTNDLIIAYAVLAVGVVALIIGLIL